MREIIDNTYIFSTSRQRFGKIIASRSRNKPRTDDVFKHLTLCPEEKSFLDNAFTVDNKIIAVMGRDERTVILFVKDFCGVQSLCLAIEIFKCPSAVLKSSLARAVDNIAISDRVCELIQLREVDFYEKIATEDYLDSLVEAILLESFADFVENTIPDIVCAAGRLAGIETDVSVAELSNEDMGVARQPVAGKESLAILAILAMSAREYSATRSLSVTVKRFEFGIAVKASFERGQDGIGDLAEHLSDIASSVEMILSANLTENGFECNFLPYVRDVGLVGVKAPREITQQLFYFG